MKVRKNIVKILGIVAVSGMFMVGCSQTTNTQSRSEKTQKIDEASQSQNNASNKDYIGEDKAKEIMQKEVPNAKFVSFRLDEDNDGDDRAEYEGKLVKGDKEYDITVDALTGEIVESEQEKYDGRYEDDKNYIGKEEAEKIMQKEVPNAKVIVIELDKNLDDAEGAQYEGKLQKDNMEYDISVDAKTGKILSIEKEAMNK